MKKIKLTQGMVALVDDEDFEYLCKFKWYINNKLGLYAKGLVNGKYMMMHRLIMDTPCNMVCDHIDHNTLNNQRSNLRNCTTMQNCMNRKKVSSYCSSKYKGVHWHKLQPHWMARIRINKKRYYLGRFPTERDAAEAYNKAALNHFGEFALINKIG